MRRAWCVLVIVVAGPAVALAGDRQADQGALKPFAGLVGSWKGTGQPVRNSARGAWRESAEWTWELTADSAALRLDVQAGKYIKSARLRPSGEPGRLRLELALADGSTRSFSGEAGPRHVATLEADGPDEEGVTRITLTPLHDSRFLLLLEGRRGEGGAVGRLAEVGYTRQGIAFAVGDSYPVCIVTEGRGTIKVSHRGKDYWVCCSGCRELFEEDPDGILAEAEARKDAKPAGARPED